METHYMEAHRLYHEYAHILEHWDSLSHVERVTRLDSLHARAQAWLELCSWHYEI